MTAQVLLDTKVTDLKTFIESINKKGSKRNGNRVHYGWLKKKRK